jgi:hypothetical protein
MEEESEEKVRQLNVGLKPIHIDPNQAEPLQTLPQRLYTLNIYGVKINVCTDSSLCCEELSTTYQQFITEDSQNPDAVIKVLIAPDDTPLIKKVVSEEVRDVLEGAHDRFRLYIIPESNEPGNFFLSVMQVALFRTLLDHNLFCAHASAASVGTTGVLFSGESNSGKTTLVMALLAEGCKYFSDDMVLINTDTMMLLPLCSRLKPRGKTISMFPQIDSEESKTYRETETQMRKILSVGRSFPHLLSDPCPLNYIFFPTFSPEGETILHPVSPSNAVIQFLKSWKLYKTEPTHVLPMVSQIIRKCRTYSLEYRDAREAVTKIFEIIYGADDVS